MLFAEDFECRVADRWNLELGWQVEQEDTNYVFRGQGHNWARLGTGLNWTNYCFRSRLKLIGGTIHLNYRVSHEGRYFIGFTEKILYLNKEAPWGNFFQLDRNHAYHALGVWHDVKIVSEAGHLRVYVDGILLIDYTDDDPLPRGSIAFETLERSLVYIDSVDVTESAF